jgi:hypothetical protein
MVIINRLNIDETTTNLVIDVATASGKVFTSLKFWTSANYPSTTTGQFVDLSSRLVKTSNTEQITIPASAMNLAQLSGLFFLEFTTNETVSATACCADSNKRIALVANFLKYHECILDKLLKVEIDGCGGKCTTKNCKDCQDCGKSAMTAHLYLKNLYLAIEQGFYTEAKGIIEALDKICETCTNCPDYGQAKLLAGGGFGVYNNSLSLL